LPLYAAKSLWINVLYGMGNCYNAFLAGMMKMVMTAINPDKLPTVIFNQLNQFNA